jgi:hypothetical protein
VIESEITKISLFIPGLRFELPDFPNQAVSFLNILRARPHLYTSGMRSQRKVQEGARFCTCEFLFLLRSNST